MKKITRLALAAACTILPLTASLQHAIPVQASKLPASIAVLSKKVKIPGSASPIDVELVYINLKDKNLKVMPYLAKNKPGCTDSLANMARQSGAYAAINGTFFRAYLKEGQRIPEGEIMINSREINEGWTAASIGFRNDNTVRIANPRELVAGQYPNISSGGPTMIRAGQVVPNMLASDKMRDKNIMTDKGRRSFIGYFKDGRLVMGATKADLTVMQSAAICKAIGLDYAMNLDSGGSSGLYANGKYLTQQPIRTLSNAIVVVPRS